MKITRELIDNGNKIIHVNYTKKERNRLRDRHDKMIGDLAESNRRRLEEARKRSDDKEAGKEAGK